MKLLMALGLISLAVAAAMIVFSVGLYGPDDPYFVWGLALLALPPAVIGLLVIAPWRAMRTVGGALAIFPAAWFGISCPADGIAALLGGPGAQDPVAILAKVAFEGLLGGLYLLIFWAAVVRHRVHTTPPGLHGTAA